MKCRQPTTWYCKHSC